MRPILTLSFLLFVNLLFSQQSNEQPDGDPVIFDSPLAVFQNTVSGGRGDFNTIAAGDAIEGDYISQIMYTPDGQEVWVLHRQTDNITVFDATSKAIIANVPAGDMPMAIAMTDSFAVVVAYNDNAAHIIRLADHSTVATIPTASQPGVVKVSQDGQFAYVGCDEADACVMIDLNTMQVARTINNFQVYLQKFSFITSNPRNTVYYSSFEIAPDNSYLINSNDDRICFYETATGQQISCLPNFAGYTHIGLSGDGSTFVAVTSLGIPNSQRIIQIDVATKAVLKEIAVPVGEFVPSLYSDLAVNMDGSKAYLSLSGNQSAIARFDSEDFLILAQPRSANWVAASPDHRYAVSGGYYLSIIDFETESVVGHLPGRPIQNGAASISDNQFVACDPLRYEGIYFYNYNTPSQLQFEAETPTGSALEADASYSVTFTPDEQKAVVVNSISYSLSVIDIATQQLEAIVPLGPSEIYHVAITPDSRYALVAQRLLNKVAVIDLTTYEIVASVASGGEKPDNVVLSPDGKWAYVMNAGGADRVGVIKVDGANSALEQTFSGGNIGISWTNYGIRSEFKIHPEGKIALLAASFDDAVNVIDLETNQLVNSISLEGFPLQIAYSADGQFAAVTLKNANAVGLFFHQEGAIGALGIIENIPNPTRISYDPLSAQFVVCSQDDNRLYYIDPLEQKISGNESFTDYSPLAVDYHSSGVEYLLLRSTDDGQPNQLRFGEESFDFGDMPIHQFSYSSSGKYMGVCTPGTDQLLLVNGETVSIQPIALQAELQYRLSPNPANDNLHFSLQNGTAQQPGDLQLAIYNSYGKGVVERNIPAPGQFDINTRELVSGTYYYHLKNVFGKLVASGTFVVFR